MPHVKRKPLMIRPDESEREIIEKRAIEWKSSYSDAVRRMIREHSQQAKE